ncbi:MAG: hypothetical protein JKY87_07125 [Mariprofundus sp.]|nr:hypothetical protein [Mariprofundus sp.]
MKAINIVIAICSLGFASHALADDHYIGIGAGVVSIGNSLKNASNFVNYLKLGHHFNAYINAEIHIGTSGRAGNNSLAQPQQRTDYVATYIRPQFELTGDLTAYGLLGLAIVYGNHKITITKQRRLRL